MISKSGAFERQKEVSMENESTLNQQESPVEEVVERIADQTTDTDIASGIKKLVTEATVQVERLPGGKHVREAVKSVSEQFRQGSQELEKNPLFAAAHKVLLAGVGAAALAQEEIEDFANRLIERGEIAEADGKRMVKDVLEQRRKQMERTGERAQEFAAGLTEGQKRMADDIEQRIEAVLARMNIPTKEEIETLTAKITALTRKVDELKKSG